MKPISCNQEMGDMERLSCPGAHRVLVLLCIKSTPTSSFSTKHSATSAVKNKQTNKNICCNGDDESGMSS